MQNKPYERAISHIQAAMTPQERKRKLEEFRQAALRGASRLAGRSTISTSEESPLLPAIIRSKLKR